MKKYIILLSLLVLLVGYYILAYTSIQRIGHDYTLRDESERCKLIVKTMLYKGTEYAWGFSYRGDVPEIGVITNDGTVMVKAEIQKYIDNKTIKPNSEFSFDIGFVNIRYQDGWCAVMYMEVPLNKKPSYVDGRTITYKGKRIDFGKEFSEVRCVELGLATPPKTWRTGLD